MNNAGIPGRGKQQAGCRPASAAGVPGRSVRRVASMATRAHRMGRESHVLILRHCTRRQPSGMAAGTTRAFATAERSSARCTSRCLPEKITQGIPQTSPSSASKPSPSGGGCSALARSSFSTRQSGSPRDWSRARVRQAAGTSAGRPRSRSPAPHRSEFHRSGTRSKRSAHCR